SRLVIYEKLKRAAYNLRRRVLSALGLERHFPSGNFDGTRNFDIRDFKRLIAEHRPLVLDVQGPAEREPTGAGNDAFSAALGNLQCRGDRVTARENLRADRFGEPDVVAVVGPTCLWLARFAHPRVEPLRESWVEGQHVVLLRFLKERRLHLLELVRILRGQVVCLTEILVDVVEFPRGVE